MKALRDEIFEVLSPATFEALNASAWRANAALWSSDSPTPFRESMFCVVEAAARAEQNLLGRPLRLCDLGCGDGRLLRRLRARLLVSESIGVDECDVLVEIARAASPSSSFFAVSLTAEVPLPLEDMDVATSVLTLIEIAQPEKALQSASSVLRRGGLLILTVLDPAVELHRFSRSKRSDPHTRLYEVGGDVAVASHFFVGDRLSIKPYFRFLRPLDRYLDALLSCGFGIESVRATSLHDSPFSDEPRSVIIAARKTGGPRLQANDS